MQMGRIFPKLRDRVLPAYFDEKGNQLTPFGVWQGPFYLKSRNVISLMNPDDLNHLDESHQPAETDDGGELRASDVSDEHPLEPVEAVVPEAPAPARGLPTTLTAARDAAAFEAFAAASLSSPGSRINSQPVMPINTRSACLMVFTWP